MNSAILVATTYARMAALEYRILEWTVVEELPSEDLRRATITKPPRGEAFRQGRTA
jgi:hypothetical protein